MPETGETVCIAYAHEYRVIEVTRVWTSKDGHQLITGVDVDKDEFRTFRVDRIQNKIKSVRAR